MACGNDTLGNNPPLTSRSRRTFAHEMGHNTDANGLFHTNRRLQDDEYGFDVLNVDPFNRVVMRKYPPSDATPNADLFDFMRGGEVEPHAWIAPPYYDYLYNWMLQVLQQIPPQGLWQPTSMWNLQPSFWQFAVRSLETVRVTFTPSIVFQ